MPAAFPRSSSPWGYKDEEIYNFLGVLPGLFADGAALVGVRLLAALPLTAQGGASDSLGYFD